MFHPKEFRLGMQQVKVAVSNSGVLNLLSRGLILPFMPRFPFTVCFLKDGLWQLQVWVHRVCNLLNRQL